MHIRAAAFDDWPHIWPIFQAVVATGETYSFAPDIAEADARRLWMHAPCTPYVAVEAGADGAQTVVGTYSMKPAQPGLGSHVANAGFMVAPNAGGRGIGRAMGLHALEEARRVGYVAMQFNFVVSTNRVAVGLWKSLDFEIVGTIPRAFRHRTLGLTDVYVMHRFLDGAS